MNGTSNQTNCGAKIFMDRAIKLKRVFWLIIERSNYDVASIAASILFYQQVHVL